MEQLFNIWLDPEDYSYDTIIEYDVKESMIDERVDYWMDQYPCGHIYYEVQK